jgi:nucleoid-associated protein YgaU
MSRRYESREVYENKEDVYEDLRRNRGVNKVVHYSTPKFEALTPEQVSSLTPISHTWTTGDRFYKLSHKHYGTTKYWWLIAKFNGTPTETHVKLGDKVKIPLPLGKAIELLSED